MGLAATLNEQSGGQIGDLIEDNVLSVPALSEPLLAVLDQDFETDSLEPLFQHLELSDTDVDGSSIDWSRLDHAVDLLNGNPGVTVIEPAISNSLIDYESLESADQLTGLVISDNPAELPSSLVDANLPPLLEKAFKSDQLLAHSGSNSVDISADAHLLTPEGDEDTIPDSLRLQSQIISVEDQSFNLFEDQAFSIALANLFPLAEELVSFELLPIGNSGNNWLSLEQRRPDATLVERVVIESLFRTDSGQLLTTEDLAALQPGTIVQADLVVTDTRNTGLGLIGLELDLDWSSQAAQLKDVLIAPSLPLFRQSGVLDASAGRLSGLVAASLPSSGTGSVLGDDWQDLFASLSFEIGENIAEGLNLEITPVKLPTSRNQPLNRQQVLTIGSNHDDILVIHGLADQELVGVQRILVDALDASGARWQKELSLLIENVNDAPEAVTLPPQLALEDEPFSLDLTTIFSDSDLQYGDKLSFHLVDVTPDWLQIDQASGVISGQPGQAEVGAWKLQVEARDLSGATARQWIDLTIQNINDAPQWNGDDIPLMLLRENQSFSIRLPENLFSDEDDGDQIHYTLKTNGESDVLNWLQLDPIEAVLSGTAPLADGDIITLTLSATDLQGESANIPLQIQVVDKMFNRPPYLLGEPPLDLRIQEGQSVSFDLLSFFGDDDILLGDTLRFEVDAPDWMQFNSASSLVSGVPQNESVGKHTVRFQAFDDYGAFAVASFQLTVENVNQAPDLLGPSQNARLINAGDVFKLDLDTIFSDSDSLHGDSLSYSLSVRSTSSIGLPNWLTWNSGTGELELSPGADDRGMLTLDFTATDLSGENVGYQLNLGIISNSGIIEVNQAIEQLKLKQGQTAMIDLQDAFIHLRETDQIDYSFEILRRDSNGGYFSVDASDSDWITIVDRSSVPVEREGRLIIEPVLKLLETGELLTIEQLSDLQAGDEVELSINVSDLRELTDIVGLVGLDIDLSWQGLTLSPDNPTDLRQAINEALPLFRSVQQSSTRDQSLRISAASLPSFGLGEMLGDEPEESFLKLNFTLDDPLEAIQIALTLNDEDSGGLEYGLADGTSADDLLSIVNISSTPIYELHLDTTGQINGLYALQVKASSSNDSVSQIVPLSIGSGINLPPLIKARPSKLNPYDNHIHRLDLNSLFQDLDGDSLSYSISVAGDSPQHEQLLRDIVQIVYSKGGADLEFDVPGLEKPVNGYVSVLASDGVRSVNQRVQISLNPRSQYVPLFVDPSHPAVSANQLVGLGDLFSATDIEFEDRSDEVSLILRSGDAVNLHFSNYFINLTGLTRPQISFLEATVLSRPEEDTRGNLLIIPISRLTGLLPDSYDGFDLNWLEIVAPDQPGETVSIQVSTLSHVVGDNNGALYGFNQGNTEEAILMTTSRNTPGFLTPTTQRYLSDLVAPKVGKASSDSNDLNTLVAWKKKADFISSLEGNLRDPSSIVSISISDNKATSVDGSHQQPKPSNYQITNLTVRSADDVLFGDYNPLEGLDSSFAIADSWDPISFTLSKLPDEDSLVDFDTTREGIQVQLEIDLSRSGLREDDLNAYRKFVAPETIIAASEQGLVLRDLDGKPITSSGWYDFTQRLDVHGNPVGDGAQFVIEAIDGHRMISKIILTLTDNSFGDNNLNFGVIDDPGMPVKLAPKTSLASYANSVSRPLLPFTPYRPDLQTIDSDQLPEFSTDNGSDREDAEPGTQSLDSRTPDSPISSEEISDNRIIGSNASRALSPSGTGRGSGASKADRPSLTSLDGNSHQQNGSLRSTDSGFSVNDVSGSSSAPGDNSLENTESDPNDSPIRRNDQSAASKPLTPNTRSTQAQPSRSSRTNGIDEASSAIQALFNRLINEVDSPTALGGIMLGMILTPNGAERALRSLLNSGIASPISIQQRNAELQADWAVQFEGIDGVQTYLSVRLTGGRLLISPLNPESQAFHSQTGPTSSNTVAVPEGVLWYLLSHITNPGDFVSQIQPCVESLLVQPLDEAEHSWINWYDKILNDCKDSSDPETRASFARFRRDLSVAFDVDPSYADAMMLVQLLDCHIKLGFSVQQFL